VRVALFGYRGKVGQALDAALRGAGHEVVGVEVGDTVEVRGCDAAIDFTRPDAVHGNVLACIDQGVPVVIGTTGMTAEQVAELDSRARAAGIPLFFAANYAIGAVLMMRFAAEAVRFMPKAEIIELHHDTKLDAPSGTAKVTAERMGGGIPIHSVRLPGLVANQEVILGAQGQTLTIRHDTSSREAFVPGVMLALERVASLPPGLTHGLDTLMEA
jgi:4-hydroxy-tetrahydrodipicolinate reductase